MVVVLKNHFIPFCFIGCTFSPSFQKNRVQSSSRHGWDGKKKREFCGSFSAQSLRHSTDNGCCRTTGTGHHRQTLPEANCQSVLVADLFFVHYSWIFKPFVHENKHYTAEYQHD